MQKFPIYKPNGGDPIHIRIHHPATGEAYDFENDDGLKAVGDTSKADTTKEITFDDVFMKYELDVPDNLPTDKMYYIVAYKDAAQAETHLGRAVYNDPIKGFIDAGTQHIPSWI